MSRVHRGDTGVSDWRDVQRRLRMLEKGASRAAVAMSAARAGVALGEPFAPARPVEWPGTESPVWESLLRTFVTPGRVGLVIETVAGPGTVGRVRLLLDGDSLATELAATEDLAREIVELDAESELTEIVVEGLRQSGNGTVRVAAFVLPVS
jgi:hypothetical protein